MLASKYKSCQKTSGYDTCSPYRQKEAFRENTSRKMPPTLIATKATKACIKPQLHESTVTPASLSLRPPTHHLHQDERKQERSEQKARHHLHILPEHTPPLRRTIPTRKADRDLCQWQLNVSLPERAPHHHQLSFRFQAGLPFSLWPASTDPESYTHRHTHVCTSRSSNSILSYTTSIVASESPLHLRPRAAYDTTSAASIKTSLSFATRLPQPIRLAPHEQTNLCLPPI